MRLPALPPFEQIRRVTVFLLGVVVILDGLTGPTGELVIGLVLVGVLPIDDLLTRITGGHRKDGPR